MRERERERERESLCTYTIDGNTTNNPREGSKVNKQLLHVQTFTVFVTFSD